MLHFSHWGKGHSGLSKVPSHLILCLCLACGVVSLGFSWGSQFSQEYLKRSPGLSCFHNGVLSWSLSTAPRPCRAISSGDGLAVLSGGLVLTQHSWSMTQGATLSCGTTGQECLKKRGASSTSSGSCVDIHFMTHFLFCVFSTQKTIPGIKENLLTIKTKWGVCQQNTCLSSRTPGIRKTTTLRNALLSPRCVAFSTACSQRVYKVEGQNGFIGETTAAAAGVLTRRERKIWE